MDWHGWNRELLSVALLLTQVGRWVAGRLARGARHEHRDRRVGELTGLISVLPAGARLMQQRPDGTVLQITLPGPMLPPEL